jgi:hypothetical protein
MLTAAAIAMVGYGLYSVGIGLGGFIGLVALEAWASLGLVLLGLLLALAATFVRVRLPGGIALALSAMLGLQALSLHNDLHLHGGTVPLLQLTRGAFAALLVGLALAGSRSGRSFGEPDL